MSWTAMNSGCRCSNCCCSASAGSQETNSSRSLPPIWRPISSFSAASIVLVRRGTGSRARSGRAWMPRRRAIRAAAAEAAGDGAADSCGVPPAGCCARARHSSTPFGWRAWTRVACHSSISSCEAGSARVACHSSGVAAPAVADFRGLAGELAAAARIAHRRVPVRARGRARAVGATAPSRRTTPQASRIAV